MDRLFPPRPRPSTVATWRFLSNIGHRLRSIFWDKSRTGIGKDSERREYHTVFPRQINLFCAMNRISAVATKNDLYAGIVTIQALYPMGYRPLRSVTQSSS